MKSRTILGNRLPCCTSRI